MAIRFKEHKDVPSTSSPRHSFSGHGKESVKETFKMIKGRTYDQCVEEFETTQSIERLNELVKILANWEIEEKESQTLKMDTVLNNNDNAESSHREARRQREREARAREEG